MKIALDFDGTYTADPSFWMLFVFTAQGRGHEVYIVTARDEHNDGIDWDTVNHNAAPCPVIWCDGRPKREVVREHGIKIDVWIDDDPYAIVRTGPPIITPEGLKEWREKDVHRGSTEPPHGNSRGFDNGRVDRSEVVQAAPARKLNSIKRPAAVRS